MASAPVTPGGGIAVPADDDATTARVLARLLEEAHLMPPDALTDAVGGHARSLGIDAVRIYLADLEQRHLHPLPSAGAAQVPALAIDSTLAGRAFQTIAVQRTGGEPGSDGDGSEPYRLWVPLMDGTERLGVLELVTHDAGTEMLGRCRTLASLIGLVVGSKSGYSDLFACVRRERKLTLPAEMVRGFMATPTFATERVVISATLEPAYDVGGDAFEYSLMGDNLHVSIFDATGHDLAAGLITSVAMAACRNTRRSGGDLLDIVRQADDAIADQFGSSRFATALLCDLDIATGEFSWIACGHPPPLLIRDLKVIKELFREPWLPLGMADHETDAGKRPLVHTEQLQPGDRILLYTDGVVEGRDDKGAQFGLARFGDLIIRHSAAGLPAPETLRRLNRAIVDFQQGRLSDDATTVLVEWMPDDAKGRLTA